MIGDSLKADIKGGNNSNLDTVWFNPTHQSNLTSIQPTYEIDYLMQLKNIL